MTRAERGRWLAAAGAALAVAACTHATSTATARPVPSAQAAACAAAQWAFGTIRPVGGGGTIFLPVPVRYVSGPRCDLAITLTARLTGTTASPALQATRTIRAVIGPARAERQTPLYAFGWTNWCATSREPVHVVVTAGGHTAASLVLQRPECIQTSRPADLVWIGTM